MVLTANIGAGLVLKCKRNEERIFKTDRTSGLLNYVERLSIVFGESALFPHNCKIRLQVDLLNVERRLPYPD